MMATLMDWCKAFARANPLLENLRPVLVDLLWVDGLAVRNVTLRRDQDIGHCIHVFVTLIVSLTTPS